MSTHRPLPLLSPAAVAHVAALLLLAAGRPSAADIPGAIAYVAEVTLAGSNTPYDGPIDVQIALYPSANGSVPVWGPQDLGTLPVEQGVLTFLIGGPGSPSLDAALAGGEVWLELSLDGVHLAPRQQALAVPYALLAADSDKLGGVAASAYARLADLAAVATTGSHADLSDAAELALVADLADIAFTGDVASLTGDPASSILGDVFVERAGDSMQGDFDLAFHRLLHPRVQAAATPPALCSPQTIGLMYFDTSLDLLRVCGVAGWVSGGAGSGGPLPSQFAATTSPVAVNQLALPGACEPVSFTNYATTAAGGFGAPQVTGTYSSSGCSATTCTGTLAPGASCEVFVRGTAIVSGPLSGSVTVVASTGGTAAAVLLGNAALSSGAALAALTSPVTVHQTALPGDCSEIPFTNVGNAGASGFLPPVVTGTYTAAGCPSTTCTGTLAVGATCAVYVRGNATSSGPITGSASVTASSGGTAVAALSGVATLSLGRRMAVSHSNSPYVSVYNADSAPFVKEPDVSPAPGNNGAGVSFSPDGALMAVAHSVSPFVSVYDMQSAPFQRLANPSTLPSSAANGVSFSPDGKRLAVAINSAPFIATYDATTTPFTKLADPGILPANSARAVAFSPDGTRLAVAHSSAPCVTVYQTTVVPFAKLDDPLNPITPSTAACYAATYSPDGTRLIVGYTSSPYIAVFDATTLPYTKLDVPPAGVIPTSLVWSVAYSPDGKYLALGVNATPFLVIYDTTTTPWTKLANPPQLPPAAARGVAFSPDGAWFGVASSSQTYTAVYDTSTIPFTKAIGPNVPPPSSGFGVAFAPAP